MDGEHGVEGFVGEGGERGRTTFKASREAQTVVAGEGGDVRSTRGGKGLCSMIGRRMQTPGNERVQGLREWST